MKTIEGLWGWLLWKLMPKSSKDCIYHTYGRHREQAQFAKLLRDIQTASAEPWHINGLHDSSDYSMSDLEGLTDEAKRKLKLQ